jgi:hypothetical protein
MEQCNDNGKALHSLYLPFVDIERGELFMKQERFASRFSISRSIDLH